MANGTSGIELAGRFFHQVVEPIIERTLPDLRYAAALIGPGSEVLGYDTVLSRDHDWAPRVQLFLSVEDVAAFGRPLRKAFDRGLPDNFDGFPVRIDRSDPGAGGPVNHPESGHRVVIDAVADWMFKNLGWLDAPSPTVVNWLMTPQQRLLEFTAGRVFRDDPGELSDARRRVAWYPDDVWRYLIGCQWQRVAQMEPLVGRSGDVGDDLGSRLITAGLVRDAMRLAFLIARQYAPYAKWLGTAFQQLPDSSAIAVGLDAALSATDWRQREEELVTVFETLGQATNALGLAVSVDPTPRHFYGRPYRVLKAHRFREALDQAINAPEVRGVIDRIGWVGAVDQFSDSVDLLTNTARIELFDRGNR